MIRTIVDLNRANNASRMSAQEAVYMELKGAAKDGDCYKVAVAGGVSSKLGCCNEFQPQNTQVQEFRCGTCRFVRIN